MVSSNSDEIRGKPIELRGNGRGGRMSSPFILEHLNLSSGVLQSIFTDQ